MKTIGRTILFIVGAIMIGLAIKPLIDSINYLNSVHWNLQSGDLIIISCFALFIFEALSALCGFVAFVAAIRGRGSFLLFLFSIILIGGVIWYFVSAHFAGILGDWKNILYTVFGFALPIGYFVGNVFVRFKK